MAKVLIIDDDEFLLDMYSLKFRESGYEVEIAFNGSEALDKITTGTMPEVVLLDIVMPNMDGFEFLKQLQGKKLLDKVKVIILSNLGQKEDIEKGRKLGAKDYIVKASFTPTEVVNKVNALLGGRS